MKRVRPIWLAVLATSLTLAACGPGISTDPPATSTTLLPQTTSTIPPTVPAPTSTATIILCNPSSTDFCILKANFIFQPPITQPGIDRVDRGYLYGSTQAEARIPHHGVEFYNGSGTPVHAAADGSVFFAGDDHERLFSPWSGFYGNIVVLKHILTNSPFDTLYTLYAHLSKITVQDGQSVKAGEIIGEVGLTGTASGSHLHFEVRVDPESYASTLNPELWLVPHPGNGSLALLVKDKDGTMVLPSFNIQFYPDRSKPAIASYQVDAYAPETINPQDPWGEVAALGDQPSGWYRITCLWAGIYYERWAEIQPGMLTWVQFVV
jgi:murein DD-endopeptidase MepM/ murein hydrolase activator NlpD